MKAFDFLYREIDCVPITQGRFQTQVRISSIIVMPAFPHSKLEIHPNAAASTIEGKSDLKWRYHSQERPLISISNPQETPLPFHELKQPPKRQKRTRHTTRAPSQSCKLQLLPIREACIKVEQVIS